MKRGVSVFCKNCGNEIHEEDGYCGKCGTKIINKNILEACK